MLHPFDDLEDQHARAGRKPHEHRLHGRGLSRAPARGFRMRWGANATICPRSWRFPIRAACRRPARATGRADFCRPCFRARRSTPTSRSQIWRRPAASAPSAQRSTKRLSQAAQRQASERNPGDSELSARIASYELAARLQLSAPEVSDLSRETRGHARELWHGRRQQGQGRLCPQLPAGPPAAGTRRALRAALQWRLCDGRRRRQLGRPQDAQDPIRRPCADSRSARRGVAQRSEDRAACSTTRWSCGPPNLAGCRPFKPAPTAAITIPRASPSGWPARASSGRTATARPTNSATRPSRIPASVYELHATILHLLGLDHQRLSYFHNGTEQRLTFVHGRVIQDVLA